MVATRKQQKKEKQLQMERIFKHYKIRNCQVNLVRLNLEKVGLRKFKIRDCHVRIHRLNVEDIGKKCHEKIFLLKHNLGTVRKNVNWLPTSFSTRTNSAHALSTLAAHQKQHGISPLPKKPVMPSSKANANQATMDDMHSELLQKCNSSNRGLKPMLQRKIPDAEPEQKSIFQKIHEEFKAKIAAKNSKQN